MNGDDYATIWDAMEITRLEGNELDVQFVCASELLDEIANYVAIGDTMEKYGIKELKITRLENNELNVQFVCASGFLDEIAKKVYEFQMEDKDGAKDS